MTSAKQIPFVDAHPEDNDEFDFSFRRIAGYPTQVLVIWKKNPLFVTTLLGVNAFVQSQRLRETEKFGESFCSPDRAFDQGELFAVELFQDNIDHILDRISIMTRIKLESKLNTRALISNNRTRDYYARKIVKRFREFLTEQSRIS